MVSSLLSFIISLIPDFTWSFCEHATCASWWEKSKTVYPRVISHRPWTHKIFTCGSPTGQYGIFLFWMSAKVGPPGLKFPIVNPAQPLCWIPLGENPFAWTITKPSVKFGTEKLLIFLCLKEGRGSIWWSENFTITNKWAWILYET